MNVENNIEIQDEELVFDGELLLSLLSENQFEKRRIGKISKIGSRVYGTAEENSDHDFLVVLSASKLKNYTIHCEEEGKIINFHIRDHHVFFNLLILRVLTQVL